MKEIITKQIREKYGSLYRYAQEKGISYNFLYQVLTNRAVSRPLIYQIAKDLDMKELCFMYEEFLEKNKKKKK